VTEIGEVERHFTERLGAEVHCRSLRQTFPGQSQETWLVELRLGGGEERGYVLRINPPGGGIVPYPLRREWEVYARLARTPIPVGQPLWYDEDTDFFEGRPFFVRELVLGSTEVPGVHEPGPAGDGLRERVAMEHAEHLARLHTLDWESAGFGEILDAPASPEQAPRLELDTWWKIWDEVRSDSFPAVTEALYWFEAELPKSIPRISLLKGNNGLGEEIWRDEKIVALSDWELAALGDPAQDWAFSQGMLELWDREKTLAHYEECAGFALPRENLAFWRVWTVFKSICCTHAGLRGFLDGRDLRPALPAMGFGAVKVGEQMLGGFQAMGMEQAANLISTMSGGQRG
jgi:aminoglycoside phosphotransferase (APT) family kinase protein